MDALRDRAYVRAVLAACLWLQLSPSQPFGFHAAAHHIVLAQIVKELRFSSITWPVANTAEHCSYTPSRFGSASPRIAWAGWLCVVSRWVNIRTS